MNLSRTGLIEQEVLHEIAMSIGISLDLNEMLRECLPIFVRGLGCCTAAVLMRDNECGFYTPKAILPHAAMRNHGLHQAMGKAIEYCQQQQRFPVPLLETQEKHLYYAWPLKESGFLLLGRGSTFDYPLYMEVGPLVDKLAFAVQACEQYQSLQQAKQAMAKAKDDAEQANKAKSYFLATMSHEIRTPLNAVINLAELLLDTSLNEQQQNLLRGICEGGNTLLQLVNDVLDFSKIEAGKLNISPCPFRLSDLLHGLADLYDKVAGQKGLQFDVVLEDNLPDSIETDPVRLRQIIQNLLSNAIKFTDKGFVRLVVGLDQADPCRLRFVVEDSGIGIRADDQPNLFREFHQIDPGLNRRFGGSGLGLAIVARLIELMDGAIGVESTPGEGSSFWFVLPVRVCDPVGQTVMEGANLPRHGKVLLVEDSPTNQMVACSLLARMGCQVIVAEHGIAAINAVQQDLYDLVLMDISMPGMDGMEATRRIRGLGGIYTRLPIVAMTAHAFAEDKANCLAAGMNDYLTKPLQRDRLYQMVNRWLAAPEQRAPASLIPPISAALDTAFVESKYPLLDMATLSTLAADTAPEILQQVVHLFNEEARQHQTGLEQAIRQDDLIQAAQHAHAIKSSSGSLGARALYHASADLEQACRQNRNQLVPSLYQQTEYLLAQTLMKLQEQFPEA